MLKTINKQLLALELLKRHARVSIVHRETGLSKPLLRKTYREFHGCSAHPGALKYSTQGLTRTLKKYKEVTLFAVCFEKVVSRSQNSDIRIIINAFDIYKKSYPVSQLDFSAAWVVVRDLQRGITHIIKCHHCRAPVLLNAREYNVERCCVCKTKVTETNRDF
ncbi:FlhC family transcriptional regulator [Methylobacter psychrophilus]|uniref:FlhC family transcriptional regulator n=1 Tax=Methylobacter psychrophilus TaxID=96941 RepID=UPI0021D4B195|nr:FlhC family transcriptional regulator [Methylobacter psychrophilus]